MRLKIGDILQDQGGRLHDVQFEHSYEQLSEDYKLVSPVRFEGKLLRDSEGLMVIVEELETTVLLPCEFCDQSLERHIKLEKPLERRFVAERPPEYEGESIEEIFLIDMHKHTIDLTELIRQELELRIPFHHACVITNGQCATCGKQIHILGPEEEAPKAPGTQQPFANLKKLLEEK